jgi:hypothetical protein
VIDDLDPSGTLSEGTKRMTIHGENIWQRGRKAARLALLPVALFCCSCGPSNARKPVYPVHGTVFLDGKPLGRALLVFHPIDGEEQNSPHPVATAMEDGSFEATTYDADDGAPAGEYAVTVEWRRPATEQDTGPPPNSLPARYAKPSTSGLKARVAEGPNELQPFQLKR